MLKLNLQMFAGFRGQDISYLKISGVALANTKGDISIANTRDEIDVADDSSAGYNETIVGNGKSVISGSFNYVLEGTNQAQEDIMDAALDGGDLSLEWAYETGAGKKSYTGTGFVTDASSTNGDPQTVSFSITIKSKPTAGTQA